MKNIILLSLIALAGCARLTSEVKTFDPSGLHVIGDATLSITTLWDASNSVTKAATRFGGTNSNGTYVSGLSDSTTALTPAQIQAIGAAAGAAAATAAAGAAH